MGKRSNRQRRRFEAKQEKIKAAATEQGDSSSSPPNSKRLKLDASLNDEGSSPLSPRKEKNDGRLEVSYNGVGQQINIPPLLTEENGADKKSMNSSSISLLFQIWKYIGKKMDCWKPTLIQQQLWPIMLQSSYTNTISIAPTGSGKTIAYGLPTIVQSASSGGIIFVLVPTRELVRQVAGVYSKIIKGIKKKKSPNFHVVSIYGGANRDEQKEDLSLSSSHQLVVVATPGRLLDLLEGDGNGRNPVKLSSKVDWIVLDEADQLAKSGELGPQIDNIMKKTKSDETRLALVSATYPEKVRSKFLEWVGENHILVQVDQLHHQKQQQTTAKPASNIATEKQDPENPATSEASLSTTKNDSFARIPSNLAQVLHVCSEHKKPRKLLHTLQTVRKQEQGRRNRQLGIVFFSRIEKVKYASIFLEKEGIPCVELHSQLSTQLRQDNLHKFSVGQLPLMLATDLAARGIDIPSVKFVIQYDFPGNLEQYIHRCGRAGRGGNQATIYSFFTRNLKPMAPDMVRLLEASDAWVDPNLRELAGDTAKPNKKTKSKPAKDVTVKKENAEGMSADDRDEFPELSGNRIIFKRASHVSDASSSESSDSEGDEA